MQKKKLFIGSSVNALNIARAIQDELQYDFNVEIWNQGTFKLSSTPIEDLINKLEYCDLASFVFLPEDKSTINGKEIYSVRDNVIFELGLFIGKLGRANVSFVVPRGIELRIPTDLSGVNHGTFEHPCENIQASIAPYCNAIRKQSANADIKFPTDTIYGPNLLSPNIIEYHGSSLSFAADIPTGKTLFVKREILWQDSPFAGFGFNTWVGLITENDNNDIFKCPGKQTMNNKLEIMENSRFKISCYENNLSDLIFEKEVSIYKH